MKWIKRFLFWVTHRKNKDWEDLYDYELKIDKVTKEWDEEDEFNKI